MIAIRPEQDGDAGEIRTILESAFGGTDEANLVEALRASGNLTISLVAAEADRLVGHLAFSPVTIDGRPGGLGLAPLAVRPEFQRTGIGGRLVREGLARAATFAGYVVVLGHPEYYSKFGFQTASACGIGNEYGADDAFMVLELRVGGMPAGGLARYGPEFGAWG
jgi:putative acetyltransferase